jgi:pimeloyl-ACP methyl ester carboxylesterase
MPTFVTSDGVELDFECRGRGPRLYACHGGPAHDRRYLAEDLEALEDAFELVYCDYRGSGRSSPAPADTYRIERLAEDLDELRRHLGDEHVRVLGHSMGGFVAQTYAITHTADVEQLVLVGTWPTSIPARLLPGMFRAMGWRRSAAMVGRALRWIPEFGWRPRSRRARRAGYDVWSASQAGLPAARAREAEREARLGLPLSNDNVASLQRSLLTWDVTDQLHELACPVLVLYGERDASAVASAHLYRELPDARVVGLAQIGHDVFFETVRAATLVREFLLAS